jgi:hypothetical protein
LREGPGENHSTAFLEYPSFHGFGFAPGTLMTALKSLEFFVESFSHQCEKCGTAALGCAWWHRLSSLWLSGCAYPRFLWLMGLSMVLFHGAFKQIFSVAAGFSLRSLTPAATNN